MKINIANPSTGAQKMIEVDDEKQLRIFYDRRISDVVDVDAMGGNFVGYQMRCVDRRYRCARAPCVSVCL
jgi:small subunit ribosomal protein S6e